MEHIAVYSGSFDPLHIGHLAIMHALTEPEVGFDEVYLVVSPRNPFKEEGREKTALERFNAAKAAVAKYPELKVRVDDVELHLPSPQYTIRTLDTLAQREPENEFTLVIGADNLSQLRRWKDYRRILLEYGVVVYPRKGFDVKALRDDLLAENPRYRIRLIDAPLVNVSSTQIRLMERSGEIPEDLLM